MHFNSKQQQGMVYFTSILTYIEQNDKVLTYHHKKYVVSLQHQFSVCQNNTINMFYQWCTEKPIQPLSWPSMKLRI